MKKGTLILFISLAILGVIFGLLVFNLFVKLFITIALIAIGIFLFLGYVVYSTFTENKTNENAFLIGFLGVLCFFVCFMFSTGRKMAWRERYIIAKIENYKKKYGFYPNDLESFLPERDLSDYNYSKSGNTYQVSFSVDGWHRARYDSKHKSWTYID